jgi:predicted secreted Zn-dependent protease
MLRVIILFLLIFVPSLFVGPRDNASVRAVAAVKNKLAFAAPADLSRPDRRGNTTKYTKYWVNGDTPATLMLSLIKQGPIINGQKAYATTVTSLLPRGTVQSSANSCEVKWYKVTGDYVIKLPALPEASRRAMRPETARAWDSFSSFLRKHEETHRDLWIKCGNDHARRAEKIRYRTCAEVESAVLKIWKKTQKDCRKLHVAFDAKAQSLLRQQPLVRMAIASGRISAPALQRHSEE